MKRWEGNRAKVTGKWSGGGGGSTRGREVKPEAEQQRWGRCPSQSKLSVDENVTSKPVVLYVHLKRNLIFKDLSNLQ